MAAPARNREAARAVSAAGRKAGPPEDLSALDEPEIHLAEDVLVPDLAGWLTSRLSVPKGPFQTVAPDWACEVLSPSTARIDRGTKLRI